MNRKLTDKATSIIIVKSVDLALFTPCIYSLHEVAPL